MGIHLEKDFILLNFAIIFRFEYHLLKVYINLKYVTERKFLFILFMLKVRFKILVISFKAKCTHCVISSIPAWLHVIWKKYELEFLLLGCRFIGSHYRQSSNAVRYCLTNAGSLCEIKQVLYTPFGMLAPKMLLKLSIKCSILPELQMATTIQVAFFLF